VRLQVFRQRPYCVECTGSHPNSEVKPRKARIVLGWVTAREVLRVLLTFFATLTQVFHAKKIFTVLDAQDPCILVTIVGYRSQFRLKVNTRPNQHPLNDLFRFCRGDDIDCTDPGATSQLGMHDGRGDYSTKARLVADETTRLWHVLPSR
jgi:hypothetical protein